MYEKQLLCFEFDEAVHFLTHLPETLCGAELFRNIEPLMRSYPVNSETARSKKRFFEVLKFPFFCDLKSFSELGNGSLVG